MVRSDFGLPFTVTWDDVSWYGSGESIDTSVRRMLPISGLVRIEERMLCFQFKRKERKKVPTEIEDVCVPLDHIREGTLKRSRWFTSRLTLHANDLRAFEAVPGGMSTRIVMRIAKEHVDLAESFISRLHLKLTEHTLRDLNDDLETPD